MCDGGEVAPPGRLRRLGRDAWTRNAVGSDKNPFDPLPTQPFATFAQGETLNDTTLDIYLSVVGSAGRMWQGAWGSGARSRTVIDERSLHCFFNDDAPNDACVENFVTYLLTRGVLFRPATAEEIAPLKAFALRELASEAIDGLTRHDTIEQIVSAAWMMSEALFRPELGQGEPDARGWRKLGPWELAHAISYALGDHAPGAPWMVDKGGRLSAITAAAEAGTIDRPEVIAQLVRDAFGGLDPERADLTTSGADSRRVERRGEFWVANGVRDFFRQWLGYMAVGTAFKDNAPETSAFPDSRAYGNLISGYYGHEPRLIDQLDDMIARIVADDRDVLAQLLTSRRFYTAAPHQYALTPHHIYNLADGVEPTREGRWVELPANERAGVLTHPAWLAAHALAFENDPNVVHRGKWVREQLLCGEVPPLPITVEAAFDPETRHQSARQRMSEQVDSRAECGGCHQLMNPLGYPFEIYNHAGFLRVDDHGSPPDGSAVLMHMPEPALNGPVRDAVELSEKLAASPHVKRCFIRQTFRYFNGREETQADACTLVAMERAYDDSGGSLSELLIALMSSESFQYRSEAPER